ncbi:MAG: DUF1704 domain-containing protein [Polyangiaceae bacterium]
MGRGQTNDEVLERKIVAAVARAAGEVRLLGAIAPVNAVSELARVRTAFHAGTPVLPVFRYAPDGDVELATALESLADGLSSPPADSVGVPGSSRTEPSQAAIRVRLFADRARELALESRLADAAGTPAFGELAARRFAGHAGSLPRATALATSWLAEPPATDDDGPALPSDGSDPGSLLSSMRRALDQRGVTFRVHVHEGLSALAATGDGFVLVAKGRAVTAEVTRRTVLHEILGHVEPRVRAATRGDPLLVLGTARGTDDQEGYALVLEERHGHLGTRRRRELGARHMAATWMREGADFVEVVRRLLGCALTVDAATSIAARVFRGSSGRTPGAGREIVYLDAYVRVRERLAASPDSEDLLASGQVAEDVLEDVERATRVGSLGRSLR